MDAKYTLQTSVSQLYAAWRVKVEEQLRDDMWSGLTSEPHQVLPNHIRSYRTTSGLTEKEANEAELNNYLKVQDCAIFTGNSSILILNI